jgi:hypothetical protein
MEDANKLIDEFEIIEAGELQEKKSILRPDRD